MRKEFFVSLKYTYFTEDLRQMTKLYVFGERGCVCSDLKSHDKAVMEYKVSASFDWYFLSEQEFFELLDSWNVTKGCREVEKLNSFEVCVLSHGRYGDCIYSLCVKDAYLAANGKQYIFLGYEESHTCFIDYDTFICADEKEETECKLYCNLDIVANIGNYLKDEEISGFTYKTENGRAFFKKQM